MAENTQTQQQINTLRTLQESYSALVEAQSAQATATALEAAKQAILTAIGAIDTSDLAKEATLEAVSDKIGTPAQGQPTDLFAAIAQGGGGGGTIYPTIQMTVTTAAIDPNKVYIWGEVASLDISLNAGEAVVANVYFLEFYSGATPATLTLTASVTEIRGQIGSNCIVNVAIYNNIAYIG